jgi:hypothetical protein
LAVVEIQLMGEETQRPPHAESAAAELSFVLPVTRESPFPLAFGTVTNDGATRFGTATRGDAPRAPMAAGKSPPIVHMRMHFFELLSPGLSLPKGV